MRSMGRVMLLIAFGLCLTWIHGYSFAATPSDPFFALDFNTYKPGSYSLQDLRRDWGVRNDQNGVRDGRTSIACENDCTNRYLTISYPAKCYGPEESGAQWMYDLPSGNDYAFLSYRVRFMNNFEFVKGGKLPGLAGGKANTGGDKPNGADGWSARIMWRENGKIVQYVYHPLQPTDYGQDFEWGGRRFTPGKWHLVQTFIMMNSPGKQDGVLRCWLDGEMVLNRQDMLFRTTSDLKVDKMYFSTFFGGDDVSWAPSHDMEIDFDDIIISYQYGE